MGETGRPRITLPVEADCLYAYSTVPGKCLVSQCISVSSLWLFVFTYLAVFTCCWRHAESLLLEWFTGDRSRMYTKMWLAVGSIQDILTFTYLVPTFHLCVISRSLCQDAAANSVCAFVTRLLDYCVALCWLVSCIDSPTNPVLCSAARLIGRIPRLLLFRLTYLAPCTGCLCL